MSAIVAKNSWEIPALFHFLQQEGHVNEDEMYRAFNMGIGMIAVVSPTNANTILKHADAYVIGTIIKGEKKVVLK